MPTNAHDGFTELWPTLFLHRRIYGWETPNRHLQRMILEREEAHSSLTTDYSSYNLFESVVPVIGWLRQCINKTVIDYLSRQGIDYAVNWHVQGWANVNRAGDYHNLHNHPHSYLSGTYYVAVPSSYPARAGRGDLNPGAVSFFDPRPQANMNAIRADRQINPEHRIDPNPGDIMLWPSFLHHLVHPNLSEELRISVSFNVILKWSNDYLPAQ